MGVTGFLNRINDMVVRENIDVDANSLQMLQAEFPEMTADKAAKLERYSLYRNSDKGDVKGVQLNVSANLFEGFNLSANYAYTYARSKSGEDWMTLERSIRHAATIAANYHRQWGKYKMNINLNGRLQSKTYYPDYEDAHLASGCGTSIPPILLMWQDGLSLNPVSVSIISLTG